VCHPEGVSFSVHGVEQGATTACSSMRRRGKHSRYVGDAVTGGDKLRRRDHCLIAQHDKIVKLAVAEHGIMRPMLLTQLRRLRDKRGAVDLPHLETIRVLSRALRCADASRHQHLDFRAARFIPAVFYLAPAVAARQFALEPLRLAHEA
jgi:hypothetical protein